MQCCKILIVSFLTKNSRKRLCFCSLGQTGLSSKTFPARVRFSKLKRVSLHVSVVWKLFWKRNPSAFQVFRSVFECGCCVFLVRGHCYGLWQGIHDHSMGQRRDFSASDVVQLRDMHLGGEVCPSSGSKNPNLLCKAWDSERIPIFMAIS